MTRTKRKNLGWRLAVAAAMVLGTVAAFAPSAGANGGRPVRQQQIPFIGYVKGYVTPVFAPGFPVVRSTFGGRCSVPSDYMTIWSGSGLSTATGWITASGSDCDRIDLTTLSLVYGDGVISEHGPDGDLIYGTYTNGQGTLGGKITDQWTIVGGTGRFSNATGHGVEEFDLLVPASSITFTSQPLPFINPWLGTISFDVPHGH